jgi:zinc/manganese transport system substrate-binding protein
MLRMSLICVVGLAVMAGCGSTGEKQPDVVATTTHVADLAKGVAGEEAEVHAILTAEADPHDYEPRPSDAAAISGASVIFTSGGEVDAWVDELIENSGTDAKVVSLLDRMPVTRSPDGELDPHWWHDPRNARVAVEHIAESLSEVKPDMAAAFARNARDLSGEIRELDRRVARCMRGVPADARKLVTSHDSFGYLAQRYDIEVVGAALPALTTQGQPSSGETADLVDLIRDEGVRAVFAEAGLPGEIEEAVADEAGVEVGTDLYADALGPRGSEGATYVGAFAANASALADAFTDGATTCDALVAS